MAEQKSRIYSLPEITEINDDMYLMLDASDTGARRFNLKTFYDKVDGVQASADAANTAATTAAAAVDSANQAAQQAASAAESATTTVQGLVEDVNEAIEAVGDVTEQAVPLMSATTRGGAKLGAGLEVTDGILSVNTTAFGDGSQAGTILSLDAKGWAEQDTTTGKNLLPRRKSNVTSNGITFTVNADGSVTANGTSLAQAVCFLAYDLSKTYFANGTYVLSGTPSNASASTFMITIQFVDATSDASSWVGQSSSTPLVFTLDTSVRYIKNIYIEVKPNVTVNNTTFYPQLELGSTATAYEPYTGVAPSPSPDYPQEIRVCSGRNLLKNVATSQAVNGVTFTKNLDGSITANGTTSAQIALLVGSVELSAGTYTVSGAPQGSSNTTYFINIDPVMDDSSTASNYNVFNTYTATSTQTKTYSVRIYIRSGQTVSNLTFRPQIERGSVATPYAPYGYVGMEAKTKNLLDIGNIHSSYRATTSIHGDDITITSNTSGYVAVEYLVDVTVGEQYTISCAGNSGYADRSVAIINEAKTGTIATTKTSVSFVAPYTPLAVRLIVGAVSGSGISATFSKVQLEKGSTHTPYEPYCNSTTPIPLPLRGWVGSLPDGTADTLTLDGAGKVTWEKACNEVVLDGSTNAFTGVFAPTQGNTGYRFDSAISDAYKPAEITLRILVSRGQPNADTSGSHRWKIGNCMMYGGSFYIVLGNCTTVAEANEWLQSNPVTVLYPLETSVTEERGYIEMPEIPVGASISIPELDELGVKYCMDASALEMARMWYGKAKSEYAEELMELRMTVAELATRMS